MWDQMMALGILEPLTGRLPLFAFKGLAVVGLGFLGLALLRRRSASTRYFCWLLIFLALPLVPLGPLSGSRWHLPLPVLPSPTAAAAAALPPSSSGVAAPAIETIQKPVRSLAEPAPFNKKAGRSPQKPELERSTVPTPPLTLLALIWLIGAGLMLAWYGLGHLLMWHAGRRGDPRGLERWATRMANLAAGRATPRIRVCTSVDAPMLWGFFRPLLLLPAQARSWSEDHIHMTLTHELYHLRRHDHRINALVQVVVALHWFNPLVYMARKRLAFEQERSCDDAVIRSGVAPHAYAELLLSLAWRPRGILPAPSAAVSLGFDVKARLRQVLAHDNSRGRVGRLALFFLGSAVCLLLVPMAMLRPVAVASSLPTRGITPVPARFEERRETVEEPRQSFQEGEPGG